MSTTKNVIVVTVTPQKKSKQNTISIKKNSHMKKKTTQSQPSKQRKQAPVKAKGAAAKKQLVRRQRKKQNKWLNKVLPGLEDDEQLDHLLAQVLNDKARIKKPNPKRLTTYKMLKNPHNAGLSSDEDGEECNDQSSPPPLLHESPLFHFAPPTFTPSAPPPQHVWNV